MRIIAFAALGTLFCPLAWGQQSSVNTSSQGNKVYIEVSPLDLRSNLDTLFSNTASLGSTLENLSWADVLENGTSPGVDVDFSGYDATGLGQVTTTGTFTGDSLNLNKDAVITGRLTIGNVTVLNDSLTVSGFVSLGDSLEVVKAVTIGQTLHVTGITSLGDSLHVVGNVDFDALFNVDGVASFGSSMSIAEHLTADSISVVDVINGQVNSIGNHTTDDLTEGTANLYFTTARAQSAITGGTGVAVNSGSVSIGQAVSTTSNVTFNNLVANGSSDLNGTLDVDGTTELDGLNVDGATTLDALTADGAVDINANADVSGTLNVSGVTSLNGGLKMANGTQGNGYFMVSDANGNASWQSVSASVTVHTSAVTMRGMSSPITKPTTMLRDEITLTDDGSGWCTVDMSYEFSNAAGTSGGVSESRVFQLPAGYQFDLSYHEVATGVHMLIGENGWYLGGIAAALADSHGWTISASGFWDPLCVVPLNATEFRVGMRNGGDYPWNYIGPQYHMTDPHNLDVTFRFKKN